MPDGHILFGIEKYAKDVKGTPLENPDARLHALTRRSPESQARLAPLMALARRLLIWCGINSGNRRQALRAPFARRERK